MLPSTVYPHSAELARGAGNRIPEVRERVLPGSFKSLGGRTLRPLAACGAGGAAGGAGASFEDCRTTLGVRAGGGVEVETGTGRTGVDEGTGAEAGAGAGAGVDAGAGAAD